VELKREDYERKVDTRDVLLARLSDAVARIKNNENQLRRRTRYIRTPFAKCIEVDGGIFEHLFCTVTDLSFLCNKFI
jgi:hypothetical protein